MDASINVGLFKRQRPVNYLNALDVCTGGHPIERIIEDSSMAVDAKDGSSHGLPSCMLTESRREDAV